MAWLVVLGEGSWSYTRERVWEDGPGQPPPGAPLDADGHPRTGRWRYDSLTFKGEHGPYRVDDDVARAAVETGYDFLLVREEEPEVDLEPPTGELTPEDVEEGTGPKGARLVVEEEPEPEPEEPQDAAESDDDFSPRLHGCPLCETAWPTQARLDRHIEFHHPDVHGDNLAEVVAAHKALREKEEELRRMRDHQGPMRPEDRESLGE